jgi:mRNA-degrading endonuclease HigB of HigAB toxin-antitoxin module
LPPKTFSREGGNCYLKLSDKPLCFQVLFKSESRELEIFNIAGNKYRLIAKIYYQQQTVLIRFVLTHAEYDREGWKHDCHC